VIGDFNENEIVLCTVIDTIFDALRHFTKNDLSKTKLGKNLGNLALIIDEIIDTG